MSSSDWVAAGLLSTTALIFLTSEGSVSLLTLTEFSLLAQSLGFIIMCFPALEAVWSLAVRLALFQLLLLPEMRTAFGLFFAALWAPISSGL